MFRNGGFQWKFGGCSIRMKRLINISGLAGCLAAAFFLAGGHWMLLQAFAWGRMIVVYSQEGTLAEAVKKTFDGKHPCKFCRVVQEAQTPDPEDVPKEETGRVLEMLGEVQLVSVPPVPVRSCELPCAADDIGKGRAVPPPTPPPILS